MRKFFIGAALFGALASTPVLAQDSLPVADAPFTGPHIEGLLGYDDVGNSDGLLYGVSGGFDFQAGGAILGIEGEFSDSDTHTRGFDILATGDSARVNTDRDLYIGARAGFAVAPGTMIYAKGGYTNAKFEARYNDGLGTTFSGGRTADGYRLGAGIEQKFNLFGPSGFVKAEYRYSNYRNLDVGSNDVNINVDRHQVVAGVGIRF